MAYAKRIQGFTGMVPKTESRLLPDNAATTAANVFVASGRMDPMLEPAAVTQQVVSPTAGTIFNMSHNGGDYWMSWDGDVDVVRAPIAGDTTFKTLFTAEGFEPRQTNFALATQSAPPYPNSWYVLGVAPPTSAMVAAPVGGSGTLEARAYVYTYVTSWGEESAPSPASTIVSGYPDAAWGLSGMQLAPPNNGTVASAVVSGAGVALTLNTVFGLRAGERIKVAGMEGMTDANGEFTIVSVNTTTNKVTLAVSTAQVWVSGGTWTRVAKHNTTGMTKRVYRTALDADGGTTYYFVAEIAANASAYSDTVAGASLGEPLSTLGWDMPPTTLRGIVSLPNGIMAGFSNNELCFSEPYAPYAWPVQYRLTSDFPIVAIGAFGQSIVVGTQGTPYVASGSDPATMSMTKASYAWPCLAKRGMVSFAGNVYYPTSLGLASIGVSGESIVTEGLYTQYDWGKLNPGSFIASHYNGNYYTYYSGAPGGIAILSRDFGVVTMELAPSALWADPTTGVLYYQSNGTIYNMHPNSGNPKRSDWTSREFVIPTPVNLGAAQINALYALTPTQQAEVAAWNTAVYQSNLGVIAGAQDGVGGALNVSPVNTLRINGSDINDDYRSGGGAVEFYLWANGELMYSTNVPGEAAFRLPAGLKYDNYKVQVSSDVSIQAVLVAETMNGLRSV